MTSIQPNAPRLQQFVELAQATQQMTRGKDVADADRVRNQGEATRGGETSAPNAGQAFESRYARPAPPPGAAKGSASTRKRDKQDFMRKVRRREPDEGGGRQGGSQPEPEAQEAVEAHAGADEHDGAEAQEHGSELGSESEADMTAQSD